MLQNSTIRQRKAPPPNIRDAAGRMVKEGEKTFAYGWLDKVMQVAENGKTTQTYAYDMRGQLLRQTAATTGSFPVKPASHC